MLQEIGRVTAPIAYGIAGEFGTLGALVRGLEDGGPLRLEKVRKSVNKEGEVGERAVGQAVSRRVCKIFLGRDEGSTDI
jgi:crossover junction endonuclease EME1